jgi:hypothetical protein
VRVEESEHSAPQQEPGTGVVEVGGLQNPAPNGSDVAWDDGHEGEGVGQSDMTDPQPADAGADTASGSGTRTSDVVATGPAAAPVSGGAGVCAVERDEESPGTQRDACTGEVRGDRWSDDGDQDMVSDESEPKPAVPSPKRSRKMRVIPGVKKKANDKGKSASRPAPYNKRH